MPEWSRVVNTTIAKYIRGEEANVLRNRKLTALLREKKRITYNCTGDKLDWKVRYKRAPLNGFADADTLTFSRRNRWKTATLPYRGYASTDSMTKKEKLMNRNTEAIVQMYSGITKTLMEDVEDQFGDELYVNGNAAGNSKRMHGIESWTADAGNTITFATGVEESATAGDKAAAPNATYAGLSTQLGAFGGTWTGSWPNGSGDAHYDFWSPTLVNYTSTAFVGTGDTFATQGDEAVRYGIIRSQKNKSRKGKLDLILLESDLYESFLGLIDGKERFVAHPGKMEGSLAKLGFSDSISFDGVDISWEYGIPANVGYGFNVDEMELCSMQSQLFVPEGPDYDIASQSWRFSIDYYGNLKANPRCSVKFENYA